VDGGPATRDFLGSCPSGRQRSSSIIVIETLARPAPRRLRLGSVCLPRRHRKPRSWCSRFGRLAFAHGVMAPAAKASRSDFVIAWWITKDPKAALTDYVLLAWPAARFLAVPREFGQRTSWSSVPLVASPRWFRLGSCRRAGSVTGRGFRRPNHQRMRGVCDDGL